MQNSQLKKYKKSDLSHNWCLEWSNWSLFPFNRLTTMQIMEAWLRRRRMRVQMTQTLRWDILSGHKPWLNFSSIPSAYETSIITLTRTHVSSVVQFRLFKVVLSFHFAGFSSSSFIWPFLEGCKQFFSWGVI